MPQISQDDVMDLLGHRRFVVIEGPPGTGKTRMARQILEQRYQRFGRTVQFHPNTTYENFIGGLAPVHEKGDGNAGIGFRFAPKPGFLFEAAAQAESSGQPYLLHIDEINRADLGKILGEAIYLLEVNPESPRVVDLPYDFGPPFHQRLRLPENLHILGTMNSADRSIAIVDVAVRRRFAFVPLWPSMRAVEENGCPWSVKAYRRLVSIFVEHAPDEALSLVPGHSYFLEADETRARSNLRIGLAPLLAEYLAQGYVAGFAEHIRAYLQWLGSR
jgi:5-methylcytosine-specific restriction enzyme B